jgi:hypothetical protein
MPLFPEPTEPRRRPLGWVEPVVRWLVESSWEEAVAAREVVNRWYDTFPDPNGALASRLRSEKDSQHYQALDELHLYQLLRQRFDDVRYEEGPDAPDFRIYQDSVCIAAIEVVSLFQREDWTTEQRRHGRLADQLDARVRPGAGYFVHFDIERADVAPAPRRFADFIEREIEELPPHEELHAKLAAGSMWTDLPTALYEDQEGVRIRVRFAPMKPDAAAKTNPDARITGVGQTIGGWVNSGARLKRSIKQKAGKRYDIANLPFLVVAGIHDMMCSEDQVSQALYGGEAVMVATEQLTRLNNGLFGADRERPTGRNRRLSAIAVVQELRVWEPTKADIAVLHNPFASLPWPDDVLPATRRFGPTDASENMIHLGWTVLLDHGSEGESF